MEMKKLMAHCVKIQRRFKSFSVHEKAWISSVFIAQLKRIVRDEVSSDYFLFF